MKTNQLILFMITPNYEDIKIFIKQGNIEKRYNKVTQWLMKNK